MSYNRVQKDEPVDNPFIRSKGHNSVNPFDATAGGFTQIDIGSGGQQPVGNNPFLRTVNNQEVVPAVPSGSATAWGGDGQAASRQLPAPAAPPSNSGGHIPFVNSTAQPDISGNIGGDGGKKKGKEQAKEQASTAPLLPGGEKDPASYPFYNIRKYRQYFDVDTKEVLWRVGSSMIGVVFPNFMEVTRESPDLYGPFWVATTLVFVTAVAGNLSTYLQYKRETHRTSPPPSPVTSGTSNPLASEWYADSTKMSAAVGLFYGYVFIVGLIFWGIIRWFKGDMKLVNIYCIYGYSLSIFIPISLLCVLPFFWVRVVFVSIATLLSAGFLVMNFKNAVMASAGVKALPLLLLVFIVHLGLGLGLEWYFFQY